MNIDNMEIKIENINGIGFDRVKKIYNQYIADRIKEYLMSVSENEREEIYYYIIDLLVQNS